MYDALLFDLDGTLVDTESIAVTTGISAFAAQGLLVEAGFLHQLVGRDEAAAAAVIRAAFPDADHERLSQAWSAAFAAGVDKGLPLKPGAGELLALPGLPKALVTSTRRTGAHHKLRVAGIAGSFAHVVTFDDVAAPKPDPEPYLLASRLMGVRPDRCLVFEDSETGAEAAYRAGCIVVQVPDIVPSDGRWAHHLADDLLSGAMSAGLIRD